MEVNKNLNSLDHIELIELVRKIMNCEGSETEIDEWLEILENNVSYPAISDLIFYSDRDLTPEEIVETALAYKPSIYLNSSGSI